MSYAQVIVRFASTPDPGAFPGLDTSIKLGPTTNGFLGGRPSWDAMSEQDGYFAIHTLSNATAASYRSQFIKTYGPNGSYSQNDITVSPVMPSGDPTKQHYIVIDFNYYVGEPVTINANPPIYMSVTQEVVEGFEVINATISSGALCDLANFTLTLSGGVAPFVITQGGQVISNSLSFDFSRGHVARGIVVTDTNGGTALYTLPFVREYFFGSINQVPKLAGTDITISTTNSGVGSPLTLEYSIDGTNWQSSNFFPLVEPGPRIIYLRDDIGCEKQLNIVVEGFQFIDARAVHNPVNFEIVKPSAGAPALVDVSIEIDGQLAGTYKAHPWRVDNGNTIYLFSADEPIRQYMP